MKSNFCNLNTIISNLNTDRFKTNLVDNESKCLKVPVQMLLVFDEKKRIVQCRNTEMVGHQSYVGTRRYLHKLKEILSMYLKLEVCRFSVRYYEIYLIIHL